jgi:T4 RnlA family RNA ligase
MTTTNKILERVDWKVLNDYIDNNLIMANKHPEYDIWILNYSPKTQAKKFWDEYTLACRGLVVDAEGNILARPFKKFKNYEEHDPSEIDMSKKFEIFEKMDGSLIILFYYEPRMQWIVASRGSFISEQMLEAEKMLPASVYDKLNVRLTYLFEILYPENRIVVDYGNRRELVLLTVIETATGYEVPYQSVLPTYSKYFTVVKKYDVTVNNLNDLKRLEEDNREGFVVKFEDGFRVKVKFSEYIRLHGILTNVSNLTIWEHLKNNYNFNELLDRVPDEFYDWLQKTVKVIQQSFNEIERRALKEFVIIYHVNGITGRKEFAAEAVKSELRGILFKLYDKRSYDEIIWKSIRPVYSKPFKDGLEVQDFEAEVL